MSSPSSWSWKGQPIPFVPYVSNEEKESMGFTNRHAASLTNKVAVELRFLFHSHGFGKVAWLIDIRTFEHGHMISQ